MFDTSVVHPLGLAAASSMHIQAYNRSGASIAAGSVLQMNFHQVGSETSTVAFGDDNGIFANVITPVSTDGTVPIGVGSVYCIATETVADDASGRFMVRGIREAFCVSGDEDIAVGSPLVPATANNLDSNYADGEKFVAIALTTLSETSTRTLTNVLFDGLTGFGQAAAAGSPA